MVLAGAGLTDKGWGAQVTRLDGTVIGAAFLVDDQHLVTCAHVVTQALGLPADAGPPANKARVPLNFSDVGVQRQARVVPEAWVARDADGEGDLAVLAIEAGHEAFSPVRLGVLTSGLDERVFVNGYPAGRPMGSHAFAKTAGLVGVTRSHVMLESDSTSGYRITRGFSGGAVWNETGSSVVGMLVSVEGESSRPGAAMLSTETLETMWPPLASLVVRTNSNPLDDVHRSRTVVERISASVQYPDEEVRRVDALRGDETYWVVYLNNVGDAPAHAVLASVTGSHESVTIEFPPLEPHRRQWYILRPHEYDFRPDEQPQVELDVTVFGESWTIADGQATHKGRHRP